MLNSVEKYNRFAGSSPSDYDGSSADPLSGIVVSFQDLTAAEPRMVHILVAFTWLSESPTISGSVRIRQNVRTADKRLMRMLYKIGNKFLNADVLIPDREVSDHLILSRYVCSNIVANIVPNIYMYVMRHVRT